MATKKYDLVIFGATGFTGQFVVDEVARVAEEENLKWAIAGRNMAKLQKVLCESSKRTGKSLEEMPILIADSSSDNSLQEMAKETRAVLNCVGPYSLYGEPVVRACIENGAHHLDISGEPHFLEMMQFKYDATAKENNVCVVGAAGFDSVPAEAGVMYLQDEFKAGLLTGVETFIRFHFGSHGGSFNFATYESAVHGISRWKQLSDLRKALYPVPMPKSEHRLPKQSGLFFSDAVNQWCLPFMGSDKSVMYRTIRDHLSTGIINKPIEFTPYLCLPNLFTAVGLIAFGLVLGFLCKFSFGRRLLLKYPSFFTGGLFKRGGPTKEQLEETSFSMTFVGHGFDSVEKSGSGNKPNKRVAVKLTGPEPGYVSTPICLVQCATILLKESSTMKHTSGVLTPGAAFYGTSLLHRLDKNGVKITILSDKY